MLVEMIASGKRCVGSPGEGGLSLQRDGGQSLGLEQYFMVITVMYPVRLRYLVEPAKVFHSDLL